MAYSTAGDLVKITYGDGAIESYTYDSSHRVVSHTNANGDTERYTYNGAVATEYKDYKGNHFKLSYNAMNQLTAITAPDGTVTRYAYDLDGNLKETVYPSGKKETVTYDTVLGLPLERTDVLNHTQTFAYDKAGRLKKLTYADGTFLSYTYDKRGRILKFTDETGRVSKFVYDKNGNIISLTENGSRIY